jgi:hypothetical protein
MQVLVVRFPAQGVVQDIFRYLAQLVFIPHHSFIIIALPDGGTHPAHRPGNLPRAHGFEMLYDEAQRTSVAPFGLQS